MQIYRATELDLDYVRAQPWTTAEHDPSHRYYDFRTHPELIETSLEDFTPLAAWPGVQRFYSLLRFINGADSSLESSDCGFRGPTPRQGLASNRNLQCSARLMVFFRYVPWNLDAAMRAWLQQAFAKQLEPIDPGFRDGVVGLAWAPTGFQVCPIGEGVGAQLVLHLWAFGDDEPACASAFDRLVAGVAEATKAVTEAIGKL